MNHCLPGQPCDSGGAPAVEPPAVVAAVHWGPDREARSVLPLPDQEARSELPLDERRVRAAELEAFIRRERS